MELYDNKLDDERRHFDVVEKSKQQNKKWGYSVHMGSLYTWVNAGMEEQSCEGMDE